MGSGESGELGTGDRKARSSPSVMNVPGGETVRVAAGNRFSVVATASGHVFACGLNFSGQLGIGSRHPALLPTQVKRFGTQGEEEEEEEVGGRGASAAQTAKAAASAHKDLQAVELAVGLAHTLVLTAGGYVYAMGSMLQGRLGLGREPWIDATVEPTTKMTTTVRVADVTVPTLVPLTFDGARRRAVGIAAGGAHSLALLEAVEGSEDGRTVVAWGANGGGQLVRLC